MVECEAKKDREMNGWTEKMDDGWESWRERERERERERQFSFISLSGPISHVLQF